MQEITLHARQKKMLSLLNAKHGIESGKELAAKLGVSERTVRNDIRDINQRLKEYEIQILPEYGRGYSLVMNNRAVYMQLFSERESIVTRDDRIRTLLLLLIQENDWYDMRDLEDEMYVSRSTLENDIRIMRQRVSLRHPYLQLERCGNYIRFENNEVKKRALLTRYYAEDWDYDSREGIIIRQNEFDRELLARIRDVFKESIHRNKIELDDFGLIYMTLSIAILWYRMQSGNLIVHLERETAGEISEVIREVMDQLCKEWGIELPREEYLWLSGIFRQIQIVNRHGMSREDVKACTDLTCQEIVERILEKVKSFYELDFTGDEKLFVDLTIYVQSLMNGIVAPQLQHHVFGDELRNRYFLMGDIAHYMRILLEEECELSMGKEMEDYLLPFLISAQRTLYSKKRGAGISTVVISHFNDSLTHLLMEQLHKYYDNVLDLKGPYPVHRKQESAKDAPMMILTTVRMGDFRHLPKAPLLTISPLVERADRDKIERLLTELRCRMLYPKLTVPIRKYFRDDLVFEMDNKENLVAVISAIQDRFYERNYMVEKIAVNPESDYFAVLPNGVLMLYQVDEHIPQTVMSFVRLKRTISWKHARNIRAVMFFALKPGDGKWLGWFYHRAHMWTDSETSPDFMDADGI